MHTVTRTGNGSRIAIGEGRLKPCSELTSRNCVDSRQPARDLAQMPERSSDSRVRFAAPGAPLTACGPF